MKKFKGEHGVAENGRCYIGEINLKVTIIQPQRDKWVYIGQVQWTFWNILGKNEFPEMRPKFIPMAWVGEGERRLWGSGLLSHSAEKRQGVVLEYQTTSLVPSADRIVTVWLKPCDVDLWIHDQMIMLEGTVKTCRFLHTKRSPRVDAFVELILEHSEGRTLNPHGHQHSRPPSRPIPNAICSMIGSSSTSLLSSSFLVSLFLFSIL